MSIEKTECRTCGNPRCEDPTQFVSWSEIEKLKSRISRLELALESYDNAAKKFLLKCSRGRAKSVETLAELTNCLAHSTKARE